MKLKKMISLTLCAAMMVVGFGTINVSASSDKKDEYWMKLKSKLDKDDKIIIK